MNEVNLRKDITSLTGVRGVAALYVVVHHYAGIDSFSSAGATFLMHGYLAVDLFFVLSGFVMALTYQHMFAQGFSRREFSRFLGRRIARIYPIYFITSAVALILILLGLRNGIAANASSGAGKALSAWLALFFSVAVLAGLCLASMLDHPSQGLLDITSHRYGLTVIRCLPEFCLGLLSFRVSSTSFGHYLRDSPFLSPIICFAIIASLPLPKSDFFVVLMFPLLIISISSGSKHIPGKFLSYPLVEYLGKLSYSVYLIHTLCTDLISVVDRRVTSLGVHHGHLVGIAAALIVTFILAHFSYEFIEVPGRRFFRDLFEGTTSTLRRIEIR
jgi:peptidoglycan/LPS O-acetylase OafA/YrhL